MTLLLPSLAALVYTSCEPAWPEPASRASPPRAKSVTAVPNPAWMAEVRARIQDASHQFFPDFGQLRAEVSERGLTARFDDSGAHIGSERAGRPITVRAARLGRAGSNATIVGTAPGLGDCQEGKADPEGHCIARLEYANWGITEWWEAGSGGFEQGWVITERPGGDGPVRIDVEVGGADAVVDGASVELRGDDGTTLSVSGLKAWDARGDDIPVRFEHADDGFRVVVDDEGAVYPVEVDPVYTSADWSVTGAPGGDGFGADVAAAGDTNGDGYDDVLVSTTGGETFLFLGSATGIGSVAATVIEGSGSISAAGDVNGDGYDDVVLGEFLYFGGAAGLSDTLASQASHSGVAAGDVNGDGYDDVVRGYEAYDPYGVHDAYWADIYLGSSTGLGPTISTTLDGGWCGLYSLGGHATAAGDVNGDGYGDVILGWACFDTYWDGDERLQYYRGSVVVYSGSASGLAASTSISRSGEDYGYAVSGAGDVDGDGYDEVMVYAGAFESDGSFTRRVYVLPGSSGGTLGSPSATIECESTELSALGDVDGDGYSDIGVGAGVYMGSSTGSSTVPAITLVGDAFAAGDTNGDGYSDVIVGDRSYDYGLGTDRLGAAWVYLGAATAALESSGQLAQPGDRLGASVARADVNDDGYDDVIVGAWGYDGFRGEALVYHGSAAGLGTAAASTLLGAAQGDCFGRSVAAAGDTDGDGYDDVIVGAFGAGDYGAAYTYAGSPTGVLPSASATISGDSAALYLGYRVAGIGDANGDGYDDVAAVTYPGTNRVCVYPGSPSGTGPSAVQSLDLSCSPSAIAGAGDVNGDGYDDLAIGCEEQDSSIGAAYLYEGSASGTVGLVSTTLHGEDVDDLFGHTLARAGDIDGDGYDDVVVGAYGNSGGAGRVYAYHGSPTGLSPTAQAVLSGSSPADAFGAWVSGAGDLDADGFDDVVVAAPGAGSVLVHAGSPSGLVATPTLDSSGYESLGDTLAAGDFNGDGLLDIVRGDSNLGGGVASAWYGCIDADLDGFCVSRDCDDTDPAINVLFYIDADADGYGDPASPTTVCAPEAGYAEDATDCDDTSAAVNPGMAEVCDGADIDEDCDGVASAVLFYVDADGDGYGDPAARSDLCVPTEGYAQDRTDCDDASATVNPGMAEVCDDADTDEDCDYRADDDDSSATGQTPLYPDEDGDGYAGSTAALLCDGFDVGGNDCNDDDPDVNPDATEVCNGIDDNCDGVVDSDAVDQTTWYADADSDGYTDADVSRASCTQPAGYGEPTEDDCDDSDPDIYPGAGDPPGDGIDQNCNGRDTPGKDGICGCATTTVPPSALGLILLCAAFARRRR